MTMLMAELKTRLPPHCIIRRRGSYDDVYFIVHVKDRPEGWPATIKIGRTDHTPPNKIIETANQTYSEYKDFLYKMKTGECSAVSGSLKDIIIKYKKSPYWTDLSKRTRRDYDDYLTMIEDWSKRAGHPHISKMQPKSIVKWLNTFDDTPVRQKRARTVMSILFNVAIREGYINHNFIREIKLRRNKNPKREVVIWSESDIDKFVSECDKRGLQSLGSIALTMIETAQRKGDVLEMRTGVHYKDGKLQYKQSKTGKIVWFNATRKLKERYKNHPSKQFYMFVNEKTGKMWGEYDVTHTVREICDHLGMEKHILMHLRHSQINYLYELGLDDPTIIAMTGHEKPETMRIHYREKRNQKLANKGVAKINKYRLSRTNGRTKSRTKIKAIS